MPNTSAVASRRASAKDTHASQGIAIAQATMPSPAVSAWISSSVREYWRAAVDTAASLAAVARARGAS
jgi:hypothetical protein